MAKGNIAPLAKGGTCDVHCAYAEMSSFFGRGTPFFAHSGTFSVRACCLRTSCAAMPFCSGFPSGYVPDPDRPVMTCAAGETPLVSHGEVPEHPPFPEGAACIQVPKTMRRPVTTDGDLGDLDDFAEVFSRA